MSHSRSVSFFVLFLLLLISLSNYFDFQKIQRGSNFEEVNLHILQPSYASKKLRQEHLLNAETNRKTLLNASLEADNLNFYKKVKIEAFCSKKERIGESGDGGKYVCNPEKIGKDCTLVSLGLNNQIGYDEHIMNVTNHQCKILGADIGEQREPTKVKYANMNGQLFVGKIPTQLTISSMLQKAGRQEIDFLKIDIEGGEFEAIEPLIMSHFVCQIFIEVHGSPLNHLRMLQTMAKYGFRIFNVDENPYCPTCCEYSVINELCMPQYEVIPLGITIPL